MRALWGAACGEILGGEVGGRRATDRGGGGARLALLVVLAAALACSQPPRPLRVLLIGDSITRGRVAGEAGPPFAERLPAILGDGYAVTNLALEGSNTHDWLEDERRALIREHTPADVAAVLLGTNDAMGFPRREPLSVEAYDVALRELVALLLRSGVARVILMTPPRTPNPRGVERLPSYRQRIRRFCRSTPQVECGPDLFRLLAPPGDFEPDDRIHPNARGHEKIARALAAAIRGRPAG